MQDWPEDVISFITPEEKDNDFFFLLLFVLPFLE